MGRSTKWVAIMLSTTLTACTGNTIFNYTPEKTTPALSEVTSTFQAYSIANVVAAKYDDWAKNVADTPQLFEVPLIGTAIAAVSALAYSHHHIGPAISATIAGGAIAALDAYYNPRARVTVYFDAGEAARCIARTAAPLIANEVTISIRLANGTTGQVVVDEPYTYDDGAGGKLTLEQIEELPQTDEQTRATLQSIIFLETNKARMLADAIDQVNAKAIMRGLNASTPPDTSKIAADLRNSIQSSQDLKNQANASKNGVANSARALTVARARALGNAAPPVISAPQNPLDDPRVKALLTLQSDITACVAKAGS